MTSMMRRPQHFRKLSPRYLKPQLIKNKVVTIYNNYPFLRNRKTIRYIRLSKLLFIMRGLPGSGKSTVVQSIRSRFKEAVLCSADNFFIQEDGTYAYDFEKLPQAHEQCAEQALQAARIGVQHIVIDNTNILRWEMGKYWNLAREFGYAVIVVEPKTPWKLEPLELAVRNTHGCTVEVLEQKLKKFKAVLPLYWGWFFNEAEATELLKLGETCFDLCMTSVPEFTSYMNELGAAKGLSRPLSFKDFYSRPKGRLLHCTSFYARTKNHQSPGTDEYADRSKVQRSIGRAFSLKLVGVMISPRTIGIRVILNKFQLPLWGMEDVWFPQPPPKPNNKDATQLTDVAAQLTDDAVQLTAVATQLTADATQMMDIATQLKDDATQLMDNAVQLTDVATQMTADATQLTDVATQLKDDATPLTADATQLKDDATRLTDVATKLTDVATQLTDDGSKLTDDSEVLMQDVAKVQEQSTGSHREQCSDLSKDLKRDENTTTPYNDLPQVEGNSCEVPRIQLKQGSRAHITLGIAEGYTAVQTGFDQLELLLCEDNETMRCEPVITDNVEITYYGKGRCTVYFDWPIYEDALFTGQY